MENEELSAATYQLLEARFAIEELSQLLTDNEPSRVVALVGQNVSKSILHYMATVERLLKENEATT